MNSQDIAIGLGYRRTPNRPPRPIAAYARRNETLYEVFEGARLSSSARWTMLPELRLRG